MTALHDDATILVDHSIGAQGRLAVRLASAEVKIFAADTDRVTVRTPDGQEVPDRVVIDTGQGELSIREKESIRGVLGIGRGTVDLEITVPVSAEVGIETASGQIDAFGLRGQQRYRTVSGDVLVEDAAGHIELQAVSGDAVVELAGETDLAIRTVSGDVRVTGGSLIALRVATTSGDVQLDSPLTGRSGNVIETLSGDVSLLAAGGIRVDARTVSGDLLSDLPHRSDGRAGRRSLVIGDGAIELAFRSVSGDLRIHDGTGRNSDGSRPGLVPPAPPRPPAAPVPPASPTAASADDDERMTVLRALERGELDVATAMDRLAELDARDGAEPTDG